MQLSIEPLGQDVEVEEGQTLLDAALRAGVYLPHACGHGLCGTCKVQVLEGDIEHGEPSSFALMDFEREEGLCLACCATAESDVTIEADVEEEPEALDIPVRDFEATVARLERLTPTILGLTLELSDAEGIRFQAGQYVNLELPEGIGRRAFSIATPPSSPGRIELHVRRVPGGAGTGYIHEKLREGDRVSFSGPHGRFFVRRAEEKPVIFLAGGSGLSSPLSMVKDLLETGASFPITLVYGQRSREELYHHEALLALAEAHSGFSYVPALSNEPAGSAWTGHRGFVHEAAVEHFDGSFEGMRAYLCGPPAMIDACITALMQGRLFERDIFTERFISAADAQTIRSPLFKRI